MKKLTWAIILMAAGIVQCILFFIPGFHRFYWSNPAVFISHTVISFICGILGSRMFRQAVFTGWRKRGVYDVVFVAGAVIYAAGLLAGIAAVALALAVAIDTGYWHTPFNGFGSYSGDYLVLLAQICFLIACVAGGIMGQLLIGLAFKRKM
jgi:hypothetical protein